MQVLRKLHKNLLNRRLFQQPNSVLLKLTAMSSVVLASYLFFNKDKDLPKPNNLGNVMKTSYLQMIKNEEPNMRDRFNFIDKVVKHCASAVFYLEIRDPSKKDLDTGESLVTSNGSGFIISEDGLALTNAHVVINKPNSTITAIMRDGQKYLVKVEDADMNMDLALLKLEAKDHLPTLRLGESGDATVGEWVVALGSPLSLSNSVTVGIVSCVNRPAEDLGLKNHSMKYIQTDASITFGNSGGPLVNLNGDVIGINNLRLTSGISFAIPVEYARQFLEKRKYRSGGENGFIGRAMLGITTISITPEILTDLAKENKNIPEDVKEGLLVWKVLPGTPACRSGLEVGDIITHLNGVPVRHSNDLYITQEGSMAGSLSLEVIHRGARTKVVVTGEPLACGPPRAPK